MQQLVPDTACLTETALLRYLQDDCTPLEARAIDRHVEHCPFCTDALEGLMSLSTLEIEMALGRNDTQLELFEKHLADDLTEKPIIKPLVPRKNTRYLAWAMAASVAMLLAAVFVWRASSNDGLDNEMKTAAAPASVMSDSIQNDAVGAVAAAADSISPVAAAKRNKTEASTAPIVAEAMPPNPAPSAATAANAPVNESVPNDATEKAKVEDKTSSAPVAEREVSTEKKATEDAIAIAETDNAKVKIQSKEAAKPSKIAVPPSAGPSPMSNASTVPSNVQNRKEKATTNKLKKQYEQAKTDYEQKKYTQANDTWQSILGEQKTGKYYEDALWYLANGQLQLNNRAAAKVLLTRIVQENGTWTKNAKKLLESF